MEVKHMFKPYDVFKGSYDTEEGEYDTWEVCNKHGNMVAQFVEEAYAPGEAKARAEAERDRLNAE